MCQKNLMNARKKQKIRFQGTGLQFNYDIPAREIRRYCLLGEEEKKYMEQIFYMMNLSARSYHKILKVARTIADIDDEENITVKHLGEAVCYRVQEDNAYAG